MLIFSVKSVIPNVIITNINNKTTSSIMPGAKKKQPVAVEEETAASVFNIK